MRTPPAADSRRTAGTAEPAFPPSRKEGETSDDLQHLHRLAALGKLLAEVVHEVRNGLVSIKTFVQLLPESGDEDASADQFRRVTQEEFTRIERLLTSVLAQASSQRDATQVRHTCDTQEIVETTIALLRLRADQLGILLRADCTVGGRLPISSDDLRQVLLNLLLNALAVTERGGEIEVCCRRLGPSLEIRVDDRGPGIPVEARERIFKPFLSSHGQRTGGLGLAISRRLVEGAEGTLTVRGREGGGSSFRICLPVV